jgi:hypothetical protein
MPDNPEAFPRPFSESESDYHPAASGMTLLDFFAGHALNGLMAAPGIPADQAAAKLAYRMANYMLEERAKHIS